MAILITGASAGFGGEAMCRAFVQAEVPRYRRSAQGRPARQAARRTGFAVPPTANGRGGQSIR